MTEFWRLFLILATLSLSSCSYNPFTTDNHLTGTVAGTAIGGGVGAGTAALLSATRPTIGIAGIVGGAIGYYVSSLRYDAAGLIAGGGEVYTIGALVGIYIPTDCLFRPNSCQFSYQAYSILNSVAAILKRYPNHNIFISGNTSGFYKDTCERALSQKRAERVAGYLWSKGITQFKDQSNYLRDLRYLGYGNDFPIASDLTNAGIRRNSRIQITAYPSPCDLGMDSASREIDNPGSMEN